MVSQSYCLLKTYFKTNTQEQAYSYLRMEISCSSLTDFTGFWWGRRRWSGWDRGRNGSDHPELAFTDDGAVQPRKTTTSTTTAADNNFTTTTTSNGYCTSGPQDFSKVDPTRTSVEAWTTSWGATGADQREQGREERQGDQHGVRLHAPQSEHHDADESSATATTTAATTSTIEEWSQLLNR